MQTATQNSASAEAGPRPGLGARAADLIQRRNVQAVVFQILLAALIVWVGYFLYSNVTANLRAQNIATGFGFLGETSNFDIGQSLIPYSHSSTYGDALLVGLLNTITVSACGVVLTTILGFGVAMLRVSRNPLLVRLAMGYVDIIRNVPVVLHVIFWASVLRGLPGTANALQLWVFGYLTNRGLMLAVPVYNPVFIWMIAAFFVGIGLSVWASFLARKYREKTGGYVNMFWIGLAIILGLPFLTWLLGGAPHAIDFPVRKGFNFVGGLTLSPEFVAVLIGISVYGSSFVAEIVRAGIEAVPVGQIEAARSIGLSPYFTMRYIRLPQAMRTIVPPLTSSYLSLTKNSSIAVVVGYPDIVSVGNTMSNATGQVVEAVSIMMLVYLSLSLLTSLFMATFNRMYALKER